MKMNTTKYIAAIYASALVILTSCKDDKPANEAEKTYCISQELKKDIKLAKAEMLPIEESITLTGEVESNSDKTVPFVSLVDGVVTDTYFSLGDYVKKDRFWLL
ncbi:efflux RND transporter periplasmic adaptor subunit [Chryseobacterium capnotolerans]|uniref:hypothetical protein n=1 Tax=Chryseobacterium capnotolerans TaxID=2759528 RepID=UPI001E456B00|nr:hypothetical protein [Chryseobacterium capnotolerans]UHO37922.1 efflux RND transporter periplasmic adaptor subunit [Chryseobacterium capnotolerans]